MRQKKLDKDSINIKTKSYKSRIRTLHIQLDAIKRGFISIAGNTDLMKREVSGKIKQLKEKLRRKFIKSNSLLNTLRRENGDLRKEIISFKAYSGPIQDIYKKYEEFKESEASDILEPKIVSVKIQSKSEKLLELEKKFDEKKSQNIQWAQELDKWKVNFDELLKDKDTAERKWGDIKENMVSKIKEERKVMNDKIALLNQTIEELGNCFIKYRTNERGNNTRV